MSRLQATEKQIENSIFDYLACVPYCFAFKVNTGGVYDPTRKVFRSLSRNVIPGTADIIACIQGRFVAFEVKSAKGRQSDKQKDFQWQVENRAQGHYFLVRSIEDVQRAIAQLA